MKININKLSSTTTQATLRQNHRGKKKLVFIVMWPTCMGLWLLGEAIDMGVGFDCFLLLFDLLPSNAATGVEVDKVDDDFRDLFRLLLLLLTMCDIDGGGGGGAEMGGDGGETAIWVVVQRCH